MVRRNFGPPDRRERGGTRGPFDDRSRWLRRQLRPDPPERAFGYGRSDPPAEGRSRLQHCPECGGVFTFPRLGDDGEGDVRLLCPVCRAEVGRIDRQQYEADRDRWQAWRERIFRTMEDWKGQSPGAEEPTEPSDPSAES
jgi:hypothetical protein